MIQEAILVKTQRNENLNNSDGKSERCIEEKLQSRNNKLLNIYYYYHYLQIPKHSEAVNKTPKFQCGWLGST